VDDNFIGNKKAVRTMLPRIQQWQERHRWPFEFYTEASLNIAEDSLLMTAMKDAGFWSVFIGIESPSAESLVETKKNQNIKGEVDIVDRVHEVQRHGLDVWGGFIVGFDHDTADIFDEQIAFIERAAIPEAMVGILHAIPGTPLTERLRLEGRLREMDSIDQFGRTNVETIIPEPVLLRGYRKILQTIYEPGQYLDRVRAMMRHRPMMVARHGWIEPAKLLAGARAIAAQGLFGSYKRDYWRFLAEVWRWNRSRMAEAIMRAAAGHHFIEYTRRVVIPEAGQRRGIGARRAVPRAERLVRRRRLSPRAGAAAWSTLALGGAVALIAIGALREAPCAAPADGSAAPMGPRRPRRSRRGRGRPGPRLRTTSRRDAGSWPGIAARATRRVYRRARPELSRSFRSRTPTGPRT
jgi:hypothetical protein